MKGWSRTGRAIAAAALLAVVVCTAPATRASAQELLTRAEATDFLETSRYDDVVAFMREAAERSPLVRYTTFGYSHEGRALPLAVVGNVSDATPEAIRRSGKTVVYLQGNIHGGEVCGKEALLILLREVVEGEHTAWADSLVLLVAPLYNADGNERIALTNRPRQHGPLAGMGQRPNAQGLDLNRDHMKLDSPEAHSIAALLTDWDPHVTVDLHTTNGTRHGYHLTYSPPLHPGTAPELVAFLRQEWLPEVTRRVKEEHGWDYYYYGNAYPLEAGAEGSWNTFDHRPRFNNNYVGLRNRLAILSEAYAYATFRDRVRASEWFVEAILDFAAVHGERIRSLAARADSREIAGDTLPTRAVLARSEEPVTILMGRVEEERNPWSGEVVLRRLDAQRPVEMHEYGTFRATDRERVPRAYLVPPGLEGMDDVLARLRAHGVETFSLEKEARLEGERYRVDSVRVADEPFQGHLEHTVRGGWEAETLELPAETVVIPTDQPLGRLAFYLLEPRSDDGFLAWGFMEPSFLTGTGYPVLRTDRHVPSRTDRGSGATDPEAGS